jgi:WD40 repeat protein
VSRLALTGKRVITCAAQGHDNPIRVCDVVTGQAVFTLGEDTPGWYFSAAFSPDGKRIVSGSRDKSIKVWDLGKRAPHTEFHGTRKRGLEREIQR